MFKFFYLTVKVMYSFWQKNGLGHTLGYFFANSSGHPAEIPLFKKVVKT
jgi:hypothetical protein